MARNIQLPNLKNPYAEGGHPASLLGAMAHQERAATKEAKRKAGLAQTEARYKGMMEEAKAYSADYNSALTEYLKNPDNNKDMLPHLDKLETRMVSTWSAIVGREKGDPNELAKALTEITKNFLKTEQSERKKAWKITGGTEDTRASIRGELNRNNLTRDYNDSIKDQLVDMILKELSESTEDQLTSAPERALAQSGGSYGGSLTTGGNIKDMVAGLAGLPGDISAGILNFGQYLGNRGMASLGGIETGWTGQPSTENPYEAFWRTPWTPTAQNIPGLGSSHVGQMMGGGASQRAYQQAMAQMNNLTNYSDPAQVDSRVSGNN